MSLTLNVNVIHHVNVIHRWRTYRLIDGQAPSSTLPFCSPRAWTPTTTHAGHLGQA